MKEKWFGGGLLAVTLILLVWIWKATGDLVVAFLSLIVLALFGDLLFAILSFLISNAPEWFRRLRGVTWADHIELLEANGEALREEIDTMISSIKRAPSLTPCFFYYKEGLTL